MLILNPKKICKNTSSFGIVFSSKIRTFSGSKSVWIFRWFFHWKWPPKVGHFQWKNHLKNKTFSEPLKNRFFGVLGALRDSARWPYSFFFAFLDFWSKMSTWRLTPFPPFGVLFSTWFSNRPRGYPRDRFWCHFGRQFGPKWRFFDPFWRHLNHLDDICCQKASKMEHKTKKHISKLQKLHPQMRIRNYMSTIQKNIKTFEPKKKKNSQMTSYQQNPIKKYISHKMPIRPTTINTKHQ